MHAIDPEDICSAVPHSNYIYHDLSGADNRTYSINCQSYLYINAKKLHTILIFAI